MNICSVTSIIKKRQMKITMQYYHILEYLKLKRMIITSADKNLGTRNLIYLSIGMQNGIAHWKTIWQLFKR